MIRKEQFALGAGLVTSALALILSKSLAWFIVILGLGLILDFYLRDLIWGPDRLTKEQIQAMPAEEYKNRVLGNPKTERWVNWRLTRYHAFKKQMRKLAREAVIFMLVAPSLLAVSRAVFLYEHPPVAPIDLSAGLVPKEAPTPPPGFVPIQPPPGYKLDVPTQPPSQVQANLNLDLLESALLFGIYGVPVGLGLWVLYRATRFAIKG